MPPKVKTTKEDIIRAAINLVREGGEESINARSIAGSLKCSTQPVFSNFSSMTELKFKVIEEADKLYNKYINDELEKGLYPPYKASGMAYIRFAKEEKELFKLLFMRDRTVDAGPAQELSDQVLSIIQKSTGLSGDECMIFHLETWSAVHGIAVMIATGFLELEGKLVSRMLSDIFLGLKKQYGIEV